MKKKIDLAPYRHVLKHLAEKTANNEHGYVLETIAGICIPICDGDQSRLFTMFRDIFGQINKCHEYTGYLMPEAYDLRSCTAAVMEKVVRRTFDAEFADAFLTV